MKENKFEFFEMIDVTNIKGGEEPPACTPMDFCEICNDNTLPCDRPESICVPGIEFPPICIDRA